MMVQEMTMGWEDDEAKMAEAQQKALDVSRAYVEELEENIAVLKQAHLHALALRDEQFARAEAAEREATEAKVDLRNIAKQREHWWQECGKLNSKCARLHELLREAGDVCELIIKGKAVLPSTWSNDYLYDANNRAAALAAAPGSRP